MTRPTLAQQVDELRDALILHRRALPVNWRDFPEYVLVWRASSLALRRSAPRRKRR